MKKKRKCLLLFLERQLKNNLKVAKMKELERKHIHFGFELPYAQLNFKIVFIGLSIFLF